MDKTKQNGKSGIIPAVGYITAQELADRLQLRDFRNLQDELKKQGIKHSIICGKYVYCCSTLEKLFWE